MRITKVKLGNYVCFYNAPEFELGPGMNFVVGKNNSGKTALIDALRILNRRSPHRSDETIPEQDGNPTESEDVELEFEFARGTLTRMLRPYGSTFLVGESQMGGVDLRLFPSEVLQTLSDLTRIRFSVNPYRLQLGDDPRTFNVEPTDQVRFIEVGQDDDQTWSIYGSGEPMDRSDRDQTMWQLLLINFNFIVYRFEAQRLVEAHSSTRNELILNFNASNLAQVMDTARRKRTPRYNQLIYLVKQVFPDIREIEIEKFQESNGQNEYLEVYISYYDPALERYDLRISLSGCGTGLAQVMAMLYVVVVSDDPRIIVIDEPQSFLHPEAIRKLLEIFQLPEYSHHQYILTTHSPTAIMSVPEKTMIMLERKNMTSHITTIDLDSNADLLRVLETVGTRPSDVFGMDKVIWVEGKTDVSCFPIIVRDKQIPLNNARFLELGTASNLTGRDAQKVLQIYQKLSQGGLLPRALAFVFDGDSNDKVDCDKTRTVEVDDRKHKVFIGCLKRRNFESYFLDFEGFADIVSAILKGQACQEFSENYSSQAIRSWMDDNRADGKYLKGRDKSVETWLTNIDGAKFLENMFGELSNYTLEYDKVVHGRRITESILEADSNHFQEIVDLIQSILDKNKTPAQRQTM